MKTIIFFFLILISYKSRAQLTGYDFGKQVLILASQVEGPTDLTDFPVLISFTDSDLRNTANGGNVEHTNGYDIVFTLADCSTLLDHEIEEYNASTGEYIAWVKIPLLSVSINTNIHMYYGNSSITVDPSTTNVWNKGFVGVWHMNDDPSGTAPQMNESTNNGFHGTSTGSMTSSDLIASKIHNGLDLEANDAITRPDNGTLDIGTNDLTLSAWVNPDNVTAGNRKEIINKKNGGSSTNGYAIRLIGASVEIAHKTAGQTNTNTISSSPISITAGVWSYISVTFSVSGDSCTTHVNGVAEPSISINAGNSLANSVSLQIGKRQTGNYMNGKMDEIRISNVGRTTDWILTEYNNQNSPSTFYSVSTEMTASTLCMTLPIELVNFNANIWDEENVKLDWQTASEINNDYFTVERSINATEWEELKKVKGAGNSSSILDYIYYDFHPQKGLAYYRLKQTDFDGKFSYSQIKSINLLNKESLKIKIFPNPTKNIITITGNIDELNEIVIYNTLGQNVTSFSKKINNDESKLILDLSGLNQGIYFIKTKTTANKVYKK